MNTKTLPHRPFGDKRENESDQEIYYDLLLAVQKHVEKTGIETINKISEVVGGDFDVSISIKMIEAILNKHHVSVNGILAGGSSVRLAEDGMTLEHTSHLGV